MKVTYKMIHKENCMHAKEPDDWSWEGPFDSIKEAEAVANRAWESAEIRYCQICKPDTEK